MAKIIYISKNASNRADAHKNISDTIEAGLLKNILDSIQFPELSETFMKIEIAMYTPTDTSLQIKDIHTIWNKEYLNNVETPKTLPRLEIDQLCPKGATLVEISYIKNIRQGMCRHFGFEGYFLSLILSPDLLSIIDARGQPADLP